MSLELKSIRDRALKRLDRVSGSGALPTIGLVQSGLYEHQHNGA
jgi:hypothetical protein